MLIAFPIKPPQASTVSAEWDYLFYFLTALTVFFAGLIFALVFYFAIKYRRRSKDEVPVQYEGNLPLELGWTILPAVLCVFIFVWSSELFMRTQRPLTASTEVFVVAKQ